MSGFIPMLRERARRLHPPVSQDSGRLSVPARGHIPAPIHISDSSVRQKRTAKAAVRQEDGAVSIKCWHRQPGVHAWRARFAGQHPSGTLEIVAGMICPRVAVRKISFPRPSRTQTKRNGRIERNSLWQDRRFYVTSRPFVEETIWGRSSVWLERCPVTAEVAGSSPVVPAIHSK